MNMCMRRACGRRLNGGVCIKHGGDVAPKASEWDEPVPAPKKSRGKR